MLSLGMAGRMELAERLRALRAGVAENVGRQFAGNHPDWLGYHEEGLWHLGYEGARHHMDFLAGAVESGSTTAFADYARWAAGVLQSRGIAPHLLAETLGLIGEQLTDALDAPGRDIVSAMIETARAACLEFREPPSPPFGEETSPSRGVFLQAILQGDRRTAQTVVDELRRGGLALLDIYAEIFEPCLYEVGRLWDRAEISVAVEHMATAITQFLMARLFSSSPQPDPVRGKAVITGVEGDQHQIGGNMIADALSTAGWDVRFLGANVPQRGVLEVIGAHRPALVGISAALLSGIPQLIRLTGAIRDGFPETRVVVGGYAFRESPYIWRETGADGWAPGVRSALQMVDGLFPGPG